MDKNDPQYNLKSDYPSYRTRLIVIITSIFVIFILLLSGILSLYATGFAEHEFNDTRMQAEMTFVSSAILTEYGLESFDARYDYLLHDRLLSFHDEYEKHREDPGKINLSVLQKKLSVGTQGNIDLYLINASGVIEYTTRTTDLHLDFSKYPDFYSSLTSIREGTEFRSDPWIRDFSNPNLYFKYGYLPTDDHRYILEISLRNDNYTRMHKEVVSNLRTITSGALAIKPLVYGALYDKAHRRQTIRSVDESRNISAITGILTQPTLDSLLNRSFENKESFLIQNPEKNQILSVQYIDLSPTRSASGSERSYVGILVFSRDSLDQSLFWYYLLLLTGTALSLLVGVFIARYLSAYISRPIETMTEDVGIIASSNLHHTVRATGVQETEILRFSINRMILSIQEYISEIENQQEELHHELSLRTTVEHSLTRANQRLLQLSRITRHDILNQVTALQLYLEFIAEEMTTPQGKNYSEKARQVLRIITDLLYFTYDYEKIGLDGARWQRIRDILSELGEEFSDKIPISHSCQDLEIYADPLLPKVFYNLIDNTLRHGRTADAIRIHTLKRPGGMIVIYEDTGVGIPGELKEQIFVNGFGKGTGLGMSFIREVLESDGMTILENGKEGEGARFEIWVPDGRYRINGEDCSLSGESTESKRYQGTGR